MANSEPSEVMLNLSALAYLLGLTIVTWCLTRATERHPVWLRKTWSNMLWSRFCLLMVLFDSWLYLITSAYLFELLGLVWPCAAGLLLFGAPARHGPRRCSAGLFICITLYGASKVLVYLCLIERVCSRSFISLWYLLICGCDRFKLCGAMGGREGTHHCILRVL